MKNKNKKNFFNDTNELIYKTEVDSQTQKINLWLPKGIVGAAMAGGKVWGGSDKLEFGINIHTKNVYIKQVNNKDLYSTGNYT